MYFVESFLLMFFIVMSKTHDRLMFFTTCMHNICFSQANLILTVSGSDNPEFKTCF